LKFGFDLQFQGEDLLTNFDLCPAKCPLCDSDQVTFCSEKLWHESLKSGDNKDAKFWISLDGHKFKCKHKTPCYTIFIVDTSKSMTRNDITPNASFSQNDEKFKNRLGSVLEVISKYISTRNNINSEDIFSLVTFNCEAKIIFDEINLIRDKINISSECKNRIGEVQKGTCYRKGLFEASKLLGKMDRKKYKPIIILLTDGHDEDGKEKETLEKIDELMKTNKDNENKLEIYALFIRGKASFYEFWKKNDKYLEYLNQIASKGGTKEAKLPDTFNGLESEFQRIANSINQRYGLKQNNPTY